MVIPQARIFVALAIATFIGAVVAFLIAVVWTNAVYGTRMAWFLGVVVPLLALTAGLAWLASRPQITQEAGAIQVTPSRPLQKVGATKALFWVSLLLLALPAVLAAMILLVYGLLILAHAV